MKIYKLIPLMLSMSIIPMVAQDIGEEVENNKPRKISGRKAWFLCTAIPADLKNPVSVMVGDDIHEVTLSIRHMSDPFPVKGDGTVKIVKQIPDPEDPELMVYENLSYSVIAESIQNALIILVPESKNDGGKLIFRSKVLDLKDFRGGDYLYLNLSPKKIGIDLGDARSVLNPGEMKIQNNQEIKAAVNKTLGIYYHSSEEDKWKLIVASTVVVQPARREICIFHLDEKSGRIDYRGATFPTEIE